MKKLFIIMAAVAMIFVSCKKDNKDNSPVNPTPSIAEQIVGKWLYVESDGELVETYESSVTTFYLEGSTLKAYTSISNSLYDVWAYRMPTDVQIDGDKITLIMREGDLMTMEEFTDITISGDDLRYTSMYTVILNGEVIVDFGPNQLHCVKVHDDYSQIILGRWEGTITSDEPGFDPQPFCEKYLSDGTNIEYELINGQWVEVETDYAEYFVDGNMLFTRWQYPGYEEERENCVIVSYVDNTMIVKEKVMRDGQIYTQTSTLTKVSE